MSCDGCRKSLVLASLLPASLEETLLTPMMETGGPSLVSSIVCSVPRLSPSGLLTPRLCLSVHSLAHQKGTGSVPGSE